MIMVAGFARIQPLLIAHRQFATELANTNLTKSNRLNSRQSTFIFS
jgi:hypothetical protein